MRIINVISRTDAYILIRDLNLKPRAAGTIDVDTLILSELKSLRNLYLANDIILNINDFNYIVAKIESLSSSGGDSPVRSVNEEIGDVVLDAADVGAPTSTYVNEQLDTKANSISVTQALSTKADLVGGVIPANQLPSFVDDVLEYANLGSFPVVGEASKIYIAFDTNKTYRWGGSSYVEIGGGVALGETAQTAYRGDRGKVAYDHSQSQGNPHNSTTSDITEGSRLYFTDDRVRATSLTGLSTSTGGVISASDTVVGALGKLQNQVTNSGGGGGASSPTWVNIATVGVVSAFVTSVDVQVAKFQGMLWIRGTFNVNSSVATNNTLFTVTDPTYKPYAYSTAGTARLLNVLFGYNLTSVAIKTIGISTLGNITDLTSANAISVFIENKVPLSTADGTINIPPTVIGTLAN